MPELLAKQHFNVGLVVDHEYEEEVHGRSPGLPRDAATARQKDLKFGELAGLRKNVNRAAVLLDDDVMTDGGNAVSIPDHHCPVTLAVMPHRARHGLASR
jgi:hypothetical protein